MFILFDLEISFNLPKRSNARERQCSIYKGVHHRFTYNGKKPKSPQTSRYQSTTEMEY